MAFNPLANFIQGQQAGQAMQDRRTEADEKRLRGLAAQLGEQSEAYKELMVKNPEAAMKLKQTFSTDNGGLAALIDDSMSILYHLESDPSGASAREVIVSGIKNVPKFGGRNSKHRENLLNILDTQGVDALKTNLSNVHKVMSDVAGKGKPKEMTSLEKEQQKVDFEFRKEERQVAKTAVVGFNKRASEIRSSYGKIESILDGGKLNRMKIASAMTSMARLLSPGIVTNKDFESLSNSATPVAELLSRITGKGEQGANVAENLQRFYDPTNPDLFDKKSFLDTARNVAGAEIPALIDSFNGARDRAGRAGVSEKALDTNFGQNKNFDYLTGMLEKNKPVLNHSKLGNVTEGQIQETMKNKGMTREQVLALLQEGN